MPSPDELGRLHRWIRWIAILAGFYSVFVVVWFFAWFAHGTHMPFSDFAAWSGLYAVWSAIPFMVAWLAQRFSTTKRVAKLTLGVVLSCAISSLLLYSPGLKPYQDGEFAVVFALVIPQLALVSGCLIYALLARRKASNI